MSSVFLLYEIGDLEVTAKEKLEIAWSISLCEQNSEVT